MWIDILSSLAPVWPFAGAIVVGTITLVRKAPSERAVVAVSTTALILSLISVLTAMFQWFYGAMAPIDLRLGHWFSAGDYGFELCFYFDRLSISFSSVASVLLLATCRFSSNYLHREKGFSRFFVLMLFFAAGIQLISFAGTLDILFAGWELVGLTSVLLVAFFHERTGPVRAAIRVLVTYRLCDIGLLLGAVLLHQTFHSTIIGDIVNTLREPTFSQSHTAVSSAVGFALMLGAMGKSAQFPVGGWLPRAMEGPTASSAVFYGGLSVHAGVFLLLRMAPLYEHATPVRVAIVIIGALTTVMAGLSGQVSSDAKSGLAYATISQVGLMFVECGLGLWDIALIHLLAHAILRYYQFLRTPSVLQDALSRRSALGLTEADESAIRWELLGLRLRRYLYRLAIERFEVEATLERWVARPILDLARKLDSFEQTLMGSDSNPFSSKSHQTPSSTNQGAKL